MFCISLLFPFPKPKLAPLPLRPRRNPSPAILAQPTPPQSQPPSPRPQNEPPSDPPEQPPKRLLSWKEVKVPERDVPSDQTDTDRKFSFCPNSSSSKTRSRCPSLVSDVSSTVVSPSLPPVALSTDISSPDSPPLTPPEDISLPIPSSSRRSSLEQRPFSSTRLQSLKMFRTKSRKASEPEPARRETQTPPPPYTAPPFPRAFTETQALPTRPNTPLQRSRSATPQASTSSQRPRSVELKGKENNLPSGEVFRTQFVNPFKPKSRRSASTSLRTLHLFLVRFHSRLTLFLIAASSSLKDVSPVVQEASASTAGRSRRSFGSYFNLPAQAATLMSSKNSLRRGRSNSKTPKLGPREVPRTQPYAAPYFAPMPCDPPSRPRSPRKSVSSGSSASSTTSPRTVTLESDVSHAQPVVRPSSAEYDRIHIRGSPTATDSPDAASEDVVNSMGVSFVPPPSKPNRSTTRNASMRHRVTVSDGTASMGGPPSAQSETSVISRS